MKLTKNQKVILIAAVITATATIAAALVISRCGKPSKPSTLIHQEGEGNIAINQARDVQIDQSKKNLVPEAQLAGVLKPQSREMLIPSEGKPVILELGTDFIKKPGFVITYEGGPLSANFPNMNPIWKALDNISISRENGKLKVSTVILSSDGTLIAEIKNNEWKTAVPPKSWDRNYTDDSLEVKDDRGNIVLQVKLLENRVQMNGIFYNPDGTGVAVFSGEGKYDDWVGMHAIDVSHPPEFCLKPMFKYPSELHLGELLGEETQ